MKRRDLLTSTLAMLPMLPAVGQPLPRRADLSEPFSVGVEKILLTNGFTDYLSHALRRDTGLKLKVVSGPSLEILEQLEAGQVAVSLTNAPNYENQLFRKGLAMGWRPFMQSHYVLLGPPKDPARIGELTDSAKIYERLVQAGNETQFLVQTGQPLGCGYVAQGERSGVQDFEQGFLRPYGSRAVGGWLRQASAAGPLAAIKLATQWPVGGAYTLVEQSVLASAGKLPLVPLVKYIPAVYSVARSFRYAHPAAGLFMTWLAGPTGRKVVSRFQRGYQAVT